METATAPYLLRSMYKDDYIIESRLTNQITELMTSLFGAQITNRYDSHIGPVASGLYIYFSLLKGQTLGEEFCDLLPVVRASSWHTLGTLRKVLLAVLHMVEPTVLFHGALRCFPNLPPHDVVANLRKVQMCLLFLFERFGKLPYRLLRVRYLSLKSSQLLANGDGARGAYFVLGLVLLVEMVVRLWRYSKARQASQLKRSAKGVDSSGEPRGAGSSDDDVQDSGTGKCMLCLGNRRNPTATQCGHIFCWRCIASWIHSRPREAICPFCRQPIATHSLVPLFFYVAKELPRVGSATDGM